MRFLEALGLARQKVEHVLVDFDTDQELPLKQADMMIVELTRVETVGDRITFVHYLKSPEEN